MFDIDLCGMKLEGPLMNAAGSCKVVSEVEKFATTPVCAIVVGSYTYDTRFGNAGNTYYSDHIRSINSKGIPNGGREYLKANLPTMMQIAHLAGKYLIVSISAFTPEEFAELTTIALVHGADAIEINLACPNLWQEQTGKQKPIICFYPEMIEEVVRAVTLRVPRGYPLGYKLSVYSNPVQLIETVDLLTKSPWTRFVTLTNTLPNAFGATPDNKPWIGPEYGGMAGPALKPIALAHVRQVHKEFPQLPLIGVGGIGTGQDVMDFLSAGATAVQVATRYFDEGFGVFSRILHEYTDLLEPQTQGS
jgi:dihydroorotate dehydrogenase (fumarate)